MSRLFMAMRPIVQILFITVVAVLLFSACSYAVQTRFIADPGGDPNPPIIESSIPAAGNHVTTLPTVTITYSEEVTGSNDIANYSISGNGAGSLNIDSLTDMGSNTIQLNLSGSTADGTINIDIANVTDLAGNALTGSPLTLIGWWNTSWSDRLKLTFDNSAQSETLSDFTILVKLDGTQLDYADALSSGEDIRFVSDSRAVLSHEIETWNDGSGNSALWVKVPSITANSAADYIWLYYGNPAAPDGQDVANTWDSDFGAVWHFASVTGVAGDVLDSSGNSQTADSKNIASVIASDTGAGYYFDQPAIPPALNSEKKWADPGASDSYFDSAISIRTVEIRFKADRVTGGQTLFDEGGGTHGFYIGINDSNLDTATRSSNAQVDVSVPFSDLSGYHTVTAVFDGPNQLLHQYLDGSGLNSGTGYTSIGSHTGNPGIGGSPDADAYGNNSGSASNIEDPFQGIIDEFRISDVARSAGWIDAQSRSMSDTFISYTSD